MLQDESVSKCGESLQTMFDGLKNSLFSACNHRVAGIATLRSKGG